jgi:hypothetical protein
MFRYNAIQTAPVALDQGPHFKTFTQNEELASTLFIVKSGSTYRTNNRRNPLKKETADVFHGALSLYGLPMAVILDGCGTTAENEDIQRSARGIMALLEKLSLELEGSRLSEVELRERLRQEYLALDAAFYGRTEDAVFSALLVFKDYQGQLKALSFGTGDTLLALDSQNEVKTVLAARNIREGGFSRPLPFPCPRQGKATLERTLNNLEIDLRTVNPLDRFIFLTDGAFEHLDRQEEELIEDGVTVVRSRLQAEALKSGISISRLTEEAEEEAAKAFKSQSSRRTLSIGDDTTAADLRIPTDEVQKTLQAFLYQKAKAELEKTLADVNLPQEIAQKFTAVKERIEQLRMAPSAKLPALTKALIKTNEAISKREDEEVVNGYLLYAKKEISTKSSFLWQALGVAMIVAGTALAIIGGLTLANPVLGGSLLSGGIGLAAVGAGLFAKGRRNELQSEMIDGGQVLHIARGRLV